MVYYNVCECFLRLLARLLCSLCLPLLCFASPCCDSLCFSMHCCAAVFFLYLPVHCFLCLACLPASVSAYVPYTHTLRSEFALGLMNFSVCSGDLCFLLTCCCCPSGMNRHVFVKAVWSQKRNFERGLRSVLEACMGHDMARYYQVSIVCHTSYV